jgi:hypothetical protein
LQESQTSGDVKLEEKVIPVKHEAVPRNLVWLHGCEYLCQ